MDTDRQDPRSATSEVAITVDDYRLVERLPRDVLYIARSRVDQLQQVARTLARTDVTIHGLSVLFQDRYLVGGRLFSTVLLDLSVPPDARENRAFQELCDYCMLPQRSAMDSYNASKPSVYSHRSDPSPRPNHTYNPLQPESIASQFQREFRKLAALHIPGGATGFSPQTLMLLGMALEAVMTRALMVPPWSNAYDITPPLRVDLGVWKNDDLEIALSDLLSPKIVADVASKVVLEPKLDFRKEKMGAAPKGALVIWKDDDLTKPRAFAEELKRPDLVLRPLRCLDNIDEFYGLKFSAVVLLTSVTQIDKKSWCEAYQQLLNDHVVAS